MVKFQIWRNGKSNRSGGDRRRNQTSMISQYSEYSGPERRSGIDRRSESDRGK